MCTAVSVGPNRIRYMRLVAIDGRKALTVVPMASVALAVKCFGCAAVTTFKLPRAHAADANYQLVQEPDAGARHPLRR
jgi:hypothetical protein